MSFATKYLNPHHIFGGETFEEYCSGIPVFYLKKDVPEDVIKNFEVIERLLAFSYYEYRFIDEAFSKALHTFEMAMQIRYKDFSEETKSFTFNTLITRLSDLNLFETDLDTLKNIKWMRNYFSHPERHSFAGIIYWNRIEFIVRLINEMYEDVKLREERKLLFEQFNDFLHVVKPGKGLIVALNNEPEVLFDLKLLFVNNKVNPPVYILSGTPLFDLKPRFETSIIVPYSFKIKLTDPYIINGILVGEGVYEKNGIKILPINHNKELRKKFEDWNAEYISSDKKFEFDLSLDYYIPDILIPEIYEFHKIE